MLLDVLFAAAFSLKDGPISPKLKSPDICVSNMSKTYSVELCNYPIAVLYRNIISLMKLRDDVVDNQNVIKTLNIKDSITSSDNKDSDTVFNLQSSEDRSYANAIIYSSVWLPPKKAWVPSGWPANWPPPTVSKFGERRLFITIVNSNINNCLQLDMVKRFAKRFGWHGKSEFVQVSDGPSFQSLQLHRDRSFIGIKEENSGCVHEINRTVEFNP